MIWTDVVGL